MSLLAATQYTITDLNDGKSISKVTQYYRIHSASSGIVAGGTGWLTTPPVPTSTQKYLWSYTKTDYINPTDSSSTNAIVIGVYGDKGETGDTGATGRGITGTAIAYQASSSGTSTPTGTWSPTVPTVAANQYLWTRVTVSYSTGADTVYYSVGRMGKDGAKGDTGNTGNTGATGVGVSGAVVAYQSHTSGTIAPTGTWLSTPPVVAAEQYLWTRVITSYTSGDPTTQYSVGKMGKDGAKGDTGNTGATGRGIVSTTIHYQAGASGTSAPTGTWGTTVPTVAANQFLWTRITTTYSSGNPTEHFSVGRMGKDGDKGATGDTGAAGRGISGTAIAYAASTNGVDNPTTGWQTTIPAVAANSYLWTRVTTSYTSGADSIQYSVGKMGKDGAKGDTGSQGPQGTAGVSVTSVDVEYGKNSSTTTAPTSWSTAAPTWEAGKYIWSRTKTTYSAGDPTYTNAACITGQAGQTGQTGRGVASIVEQYTVSSSKTVEPSSASFSTAMPVWTPGSYIWSRSLITYTSGSPATSTTTPVVSSEWEAVNEIQVGGKNLIIRTDELKDKVIDIGGSTVDGVGFAVMSNTIQIEPGKVYAFSKTGSEEPGDSYWRYNLLDEEGDRISTITNSANAFYWVAPENVFSIQVSYPIDASPQIEQGNIITGWSPAPEDISNSLVDLTTAVSKATSIHYTTSLSNFIVDPDMTVGSIVYETDAQKVWRYEGLGKVAPYPPIWTDITSVMLGQALTIALNTQQTVDGKITTFAQATQPIIVSVKPGDTWINSELLFPNVLFYENGAWMNKQVEIPFIQNSAPKATLVAGETWLNTVGKKIYTYSSGEWNDTGTLENYRYIQKTAPVFSTSEEKIDNMEARWVNLTNNTIYIFNGANWLISSPVVKYTYVQGWTPKVRATSDKWYDIITGEVKVFNGIDWANDTQTITFFTNVVPRTTVNIGDLWFDTDDGNKVYRAEGDESEGITWRSYQDSFISETNNNLSNMLKFISGGSNVFNDIHEPTEDATFGDLWYDGTGWKIYDNEEWVAYDRPYLLDDIRKSYLVTYDDDIIIQKVESAFDAIWTNTDLPSSYIRRSELTQTDSEFRVAVGTMVSDGTEDLSLGLTNLTDNYNRTVGTYFEFKSDGLSIKSLSDDPNDANLFIKIDNQEIGFWQGDLRAAYISSNKMYIENAHILHTLTLGAGSSNEQEGYVDFDTKNQGLSAIWRPYV